MKYKKEVFFSEEVLVEEGLEFIKRKIAAMVLDDLPIDHLEALFNFRVTLFTDHAALENLCNQELANEMISMQAHYISSTIETNYPDENP